MRLIDADTMLERLEAWNTKDKIDKALYNFAWNRVMEQPTAYDIDKVLEELDRGAENYEYVAINKEKAIEIVKRGGVNV